ncbi:High-affinity zinc uptake system protein ZnuA [Rhodospirillaceae bacterium LM-1]|nr:High-affinity zinc uptake system protein ZnuA [Rhodospirillaceae bacterium LM-1]
MRFSTTVLLLLLCPFQVLAAIDAPRVLASIPPLHSLAVQVMAGAGSPELLMKGSSSPHDFSLKPSDAKRLAQADLVLWVGPELEGFLVKPVAGLAAKKSIVQMTAIAGMTLHDMREGGPWGGHDGHGHDAHDEMDGHLWLDIGNAKKLADVLAAKLAAIDPARAALYLGNATALSARLDQLDADLKRELAPLAGKPFMVHHDAIQYFERRYGLMGVGSVTLNERQPSAKSVAALRRKIASLKAQCIFKEPQSQVRLTETLASEMRLRLGTLDDLGAALEPGNELYEKLLRDLAASLKACLTAD